MGKLHDYSSSNRVDPVRLFGVNNNPISENNPMPVDSYSNGHLCVDNTTSISLDSDETFIGEWQDTLNYNTIIIGIKADQNSATDGLEIQWSTDGSVLDDDDVFTILANSGKVFTFSPARRYIRVSYTNGSSAQSSFSLQTIFKKGGFKASSHRIQDSIVTEDDAELVKAVLTGENPINEFVNFQASRLGNFRVAVDEYGDTSAIDAFDRLRVSNPYTLFDSKLLHDKQPLFWDETLGGSATSTHNAVNACVEMVVTSNSADYVISQTKQRFNYQPGKSQLCLMTFQAEQTTGLTKRIGMFDGTGVNNLTPNNGIFFETNGDVSWNIAKNGSITETVTQANWNIDILDGSGDENNPSGITLDLDSSQILIIDYEWLGVGRVRVGFVVDGIIRYVHYFNHANNSFSSVYMSTPNLPLRYSIETDGTVGGQLDHICSSVMSEGGLEQTGVLRSIDVGTTHVDADAADTTYAIVGIRLKSTYLDINVIPEYFSMINESSQDFRWSLCLNPTIAGTFTYSDVTNSAVQYATGATANTVSNEGLVIDSGYVRATNQGGGTESRKFVTSLRIGSQIDGTRDELVLCVTPLTASADIFGSLTFRELL